MKMVRMLLIILICSILYWISFFTGLLSSTYILNTIALQGIEDTFCSDLDFTCTDNCEKFKISETETNCFTIKIPPDTPKKSSQIFDNFLTHSEILEKNNYKDFKYEILGNINSKTKIIFKVLNSNDFFSLFQIFLVAKEKFFCDNCNEQGKININDANNEKLFMKNYDRIEYPFSIQKHSDIIAPGQEVILGPIIFSPSSSGYYNCDLYIKNNGKVLYHISIAGNVLPAKYSFYHYSMLLNDSSLVKIQTLEKNNVFDIEIFNSGIKTEYIQGIYFPNYSCFYHSLVILDCESSFSLLPGEKKFFSLQNNYDEVEFGFYTEI